MDAKEGLGLWEARLRADAGFVTGTSLDAGVEARSRWGQRSYGMVGGGLGRGRLAHGPMRVSYRYRPWVPGLEPARAGGSAPTAGIGCGRLDWLPFNENLQWHSYQRDGSLVQCFWRNVDITWPNDGATVHVNSKEGIRFAQSIKWLFGHQTRHIKQPALAIFKFQLEQVPGLGNHFDNIQENFHAILLLLQGRNTERLLTTDYKFPVSKQIFTTKLNPCLNQP